MPLSLWQWKAKGRYPLFTFAAYFRFRLKMAKSEKKLVKSHSGYRMVCVDEKVASPFILPEPQWTMDNECSHCQNMDCQIKFDFFQRKHHCRRCGHCYCKKCSSNLIALPRMCFIDPVRHCALCHRVTQVENEFFDKHLKTLMAGGHFSLHSEDDNSNSIDSTKSFKCFLSPDQRFLQFEGDIEGQENIWINKIQTVQIAAVKMDQHGSHIGKGIAIHYTNSVGNVVCFKMNVNEGTNSKQGMSWVAAMQRAFKMVLDSRTDDEKRR